jgi:hypothetical protein
MLPSVPHAGSEISWKHITRDFSKTTAASAIGKNAFHLTWQVLYLILVPQESMACSFLLKALLYCCGCAVGLLAHAVVHS